jgi:hypothetical protein
MLYQLSYASAVKPDENSRQGTTIARGRLKVEHVRGQLCGKRGTQLPPKHLVSLLFSAA